MDHWTPFVATGNFTPVWASHQWVSLWIKTVFLCPEESGYSLDVPLANLDFRPRYYEGLPVQISNNAREGLLNACFHLEIKLKKVELESQNSKNWTLMCRSSFQHVRPVQILRRGDVRTVVVIQLSSYLYLYLCRLVFFLFLLHCCELCIPTLPRRTDWNSLLQLKSLALYQSKSNLGQFLHLKCQHCFKYSWYFKMWAWTRDCLSLWMIFVALQDKQR